MGDLSLEKVSETYLDVLKEIGNIGAGNAMTALSQMLNCKVDKMCIRDRCTTGSPGGAGSNAAGACVDTESGSKIQSGISENCGKNRNLCYLLYRVSQGIIYAVMAVSYTHLDVYKRQIYAIPFVFPMIKNLILFVVIITICVISTLLILRKTKNESIIELLRQDEM